MKYLTIAAAVLLATITVTGSVCKATIDIKPKKPKTLITQITGEELTYPVKFNTEEFTIKNWLYWVHYCSKKYGVDPYLALALAEVESSNKYRRWRFNHSKTFYFPYGIHKCFLKKWDIDDPFVNTEVAIRRLASLLKSHNNNYRAALKHYNTGDRGARYRKYCNRINYLRKMNKKEGVFRHENPRLLVYKTR